MNKNTGGPAFPVLNDTHHMIVNMDAGARLAEGMTLRDYFAAKAMNGICAHSDTWGLAAAEKIAIASYELADAMLAERAK